MNGYVEFNKSKGKFFREHGEYKEHDTGTRGNRYLTTYVFNDGAIWYEDCGECWEIVEGEVRGVKVSFPVRLFRVEYWSTESPSKFYYEKF